MQQLRGQLTRRRFGRAIGAFGLAVGLGGGAWLARPAPPTRAAGALPPPPNPLPPHADPGGITIRGGGVWIPVPVEQSAKAADKIALGTVTAVGPSFWSTADGQRPAGLTPENLRSQQQLSALIYTPVSIRVTRGLKHAAVGDTLTFLVEGGKVGPDLYYVSTEPSYQVRQSILLFLDIPTSLPGAVRTGSFARDVFLVTPQGRAIAQHYPANFDLQDMLARVAAAVNS